MRWIILIACLGFVACEKPAQHLTANQIIETFKRAGLPIEEITVYTPESDLNKLLGRPGQYIEKINWTDTRARIPNDTNATVEVFNSENDLQQRKSYIEQVTKGMPGLVEYTYAHRNVLLRLNHGLTPEQAKEYETVLKSL